MNLNNALSKANQILDQERVEPTVDYQFVIPPEPVLTALAALAALVSPTKERGQHPRPVRENPEQFQFKSRNYDLLCALLERVPQDSREAFVAVIIARIGNQEAYRYKSGTAVLSWSNIASELPLIAEFCVRRGDKKAFLKAVGETPITPGLLRLLMQLEEIIALNFTLFTDEEYELLPVSIQSVKGSAERAHASLILTKQRGALFTPTEVHNDHLWKQVIETCGAIAEQSRKARYLYLTRELVQGMNLEINQDKAAVETYLGKLGFDKLLVQSLNEAERLYWDGATPFDFKSSLGHLRSFLEQLHIQASCAAHSKFGGMNASKWGEALKYLREKSVLTLQEEQFASSLFTLMSDTAVHPLVAEREYARLMRNVSIEYGLLLLTKLDKIGVKHKDSQVL